MTWWMDAVGAVVGGLVSYGGVLTWRFTQVNRRRVQLETEVELLQATCDRRNESLCQAIMEGTRADRVAREYYQRFGPLLDGDGTGYRDRPKFTDAYNAWTDPLYPPELRSAAGRRGIRVIYPANDDDARTAALKGAAEVLRKAKERSR